tara:strand:- start:462 stop:683 length:222 start_codon:yes stop_codon:yes gene_type:complete
LKSIKKLQNKGVIMLKEYGIILMTAVLVVAFVLLLSSFNPNSQENIIIKTPEPIPEPVIENKVYEKYEMGNYR